MLHVFVPGGADLRLEHLMLDDAALAIAVIGPEGLSSSALAMADVLARSITDALDPLLDPRVLNPSRE